jgi:PLP dependent protein
VNPARHAELARNLAAIRARVAAACAAAGRDVGEITLIAVTKTWPAADVLALADLGLTDFGENRDQEAAPKAAAVAEATSAPVSWHFIGQLQTNKAHSVVRYASVVHSVDRVRLVRALGSASRAAVTAPPGISCLVQVSLDGDPTRGGALISLPAETAFALLPAISDTVREISPAATIVSAGMSGDLEAAVQHGATHLRIGTALLGNRSLPVL